MESVKILWSGITGKTANEVLKIAKDNASIQIVEPECSFECSNTNVERF